VGGVGKDSCAKAWAATEEAEYASFAWVMGFWTGMNTARGTTVGRTSDGWGIVGEVKKISRDQPSTTLYQASFDVFSRLQSEGR
jgi:hypothetical protein